MKEKVEELIETLRYEINAINEKTNGNPLLLDSIKHYNMGWVNAFDNVIGRLEEVIEND